jgi:hypothetical protein
MQLVSGGHVESFRTHANYLRVFAMLCTTPYQSGVSLLFIKLDKQLAHLAPKIAASPSMARPVQTKPDLGQTRSSLLNAWGTEMILALGGQVATEEELLRLMNNWAVVQTYYVGYHAVQALLASRGQPRPESHPKTQAQFATLWADRELHLPPWTLAACDGGWRNPPGKGIDDRVSPWSACGPGTCWNLAGKALRTTREDTVGERLAATRDRMRSANRKQWLEDEQQRVAQRRKPRKEPSWPRPQLRAADKRSVESKVRSYTLLDYLYRLRIKTNYEDAGMFIDGPEDTASSGQVHRDLVAIGSCTLLLHEMHVASMVGKQRFLGWADAWLGPHGRGQPLGLALRRDLIATHAP